MIALFTSLIIMLSCLDGFCFVSNQNYLKYLYVRLNCKIWRYLLILGLITKSPVESLSSLSRMESHWSTYRRELLPMRSCGVLFDRIVFSRRVCESAVYIYWWTCPAQVPWPLKPFNFSQEPANALTCQCELRTNCSPPSSAEFCSVPDTIIL